MSIMRTICALFMLASPGYGQTTCEFMFRLAELAASGTQVEHKTNFTGVSGDCTTLHPLRCGRVATVEGHVASTRRHLGRDVGGEHCKRPSSGIVHGRGDIQDFGQHCRVREAVPEDDLRVGLGCDREHQHTQQQEIAPLLVYSPASWWQGAFVQFWPSYTRYFSGDLDGEGGANVDLIVGGAVTESIVWSGTYQHNFDKDFKGFRRGSSAQGNNDWNLFVSVSKYF